MPSSTATLLVTSAGESRNLSIAQSRECPLRRSLWSIAVVASATFNRSVARMPSSTPEYNAQPNVKRPAFHRSVARMPSSTTYMAESARFKVTYFPSLSRENALFDKPERLKQVRKWGDFPSLSREKALFDGFERFW